jgi:hypothetical protein
METEQGEKQIEKWRKQERHNRVFIMVAGSVLSLLVLGGLGYLVFTWVKGPPTLTAAELVKEWKSREGETVRVKGTAKVVNPWHILVGDEKVFVPCQFPEMNQEINDGDEVTVEGKVTAAEGLTECRLIDD